MISIKIKKAYKELKKAGERYSNARRNFIKKFGRISIQEDTYIYVKYVGKAWQNYLKAGGSRDMLNK